MQKTIMLSLLVLSLATNACGKGSDSDRKTQGKETGAEQLNLIKESPILGAWSICLPFDGEDDGSGFPVIPISSALRFVSFDEQGKGARSFAFYKDDDCKVAFSEADLSTFIIEVEKWFLSQGFPGLPEDVRQDLTRQLSPRLESFLFRVGDSKAAEGTLDIIRADGKTEYTKYKVNGRWLQLAETCLPEEVNSEDRPDCTVPLGESPDHRPTEYNLLFFK